ncbi:MAG: rhomboid family intramembrane serine protease [Alphaproteobacteria bacterium]|nr:rhomboid family intramembrane serine protease [Alphaproteobacteria bacterium]
MVEVRIGDEGVEVFSYEEFEARVAAGRIPDDAMIRFEPVTGEGFVRAGDLDLVTSLRQDAAHAWQARFTSSGPPILTALLVGVQIRIWLYTMVPGGDDMAYRGLNWLPPAMENGETWRLITSGLLHTDFLHILLNMVWLAYTGWNIERALGRMNLAAIFFFSVMTGAVLSMFMTPNVPSLGASGGVYGLVSASVVFGLVRQELLPERGRRLFGIALLPYLVLMFWGGLMNDTTDNWAHFGGLMCGAFLAFVLDPPPFQRRPHQNLYIQIAGTVLTVATMAVLGLFGPWLYPLIDKDTAILASLPKGSRQRVLPPEDMLLEEFTWTVPAGWKPSSNTSGDQSFRSPPSDHRRSWAVVQVDRATPIDIDALTEEWRENVRRASSEAVLEDLPAEPWQGMPADRVRHVRATLPGRDGGEVVIDYLGTSRGMYGLYRVSEVEADWESWLSPMYRRLDAGLHWTEPLALQAARRNADATQRSVKSRATLAWELARWGEAAEGIALQEALVAEKPEDPDRWLPWIDMAGWYPDVVDSDALYARALHELGTPEIVTTVASALRVEGRADDADALLQLAWAREPGDRKLRRALRKEGMPWMLDDQGLPTELSVLPDGSARDIDEVARVQGVPLTLEEARAWRKTVLAERDALVARFSGETDVEARIAVLLRLRDGNPVVEPGDERVLRKDLAALEGGRTPGWMPPALQAALLEEGVLDALSARIDPVADEPEPEEP